MAVSRASSINLTTLNLFLLFNKDTSHLTADTERAVPYDNIKHQFIDISITHFPRKSNAFAKKPFFFVFDSYKIVFYCQSHLHRNILFAIMATRMLQLRRWIFRPPCSLFCAKRVSFFVYYAKNNDGNLNICAHLLQ